MRNANLSQVTPFTGKAFLKQATFETAYLLQSTRPPRLLFLFFPPCAGLHLVWYSRVRSSAPLSWMRYNPNTLKKPTIKTQS